MIARFLFWLLLKSEGGEGMMALFFAQRIILGKLTFKEVPSTLKDGVKEVLIDSGLESLIEE